MDGNLITTILVGLGGTIFGGVGSTLVNRLVTSRDRTWTEAEHIRTELRTDLTRTTEALYRLQGRFDEATGQRQVASDENRELRNKLEGMQRALETCERRHDQVSAELAALQKQFQAFVQAQAHGASKTVETARGLVSDA